MRRVSILFFLLSTLAFSSTPSSSNATPQLIERLKKKLNEGQVSTEPGPGEGATTLAEQIQFLEGELLKQTQPSSTLAPQQQVLAPVLPPSPPVVTPLQQPSWPAHTPPMISQSAITPQEFEAFKARTTALEARMTALEQQRGAGTTTLPQGASYGG